MYGSAEVLYMAEIHEKLSFGVCFTCAVRQLGRCSAVLHCKLGPNTMTPLLGITYIAVSILVALSILYMLYRINKTTMIIIYIGKMLAENFAAAYFSPFYINRIRERSKSKVK